MIHEDTIRSVSQHLFSEDGTTTYAVLDGASASGLLEKLYSLLPEFVCLYSGELEPDMAEVAPYLVRLDPESEFTEWLIAKGWGDHWGIFAVSRSDLPAMRRHFRSLLVVYDTSGNPLRFRYYDPRVLRVYLPTCNAGELATIFGPVSYYVLEGQDPSLVLRFGVMGGCLQQEKICDAQA